MICIVGVWDWGGVHAFVSPFFGLITLLLAGKSLKTSQLAQRASFSCLKRRYAVLKMVPLLQVTETNVNKLLDCFYRCDALQTCRNSSVPGKCSRITNTACENA